MYYSLWDEAYLDGRFESAYEHACSSIERATEIGHEYMPRRSSNSLVGMASIPLPLPLAERMSTESNAAPSLEEVLREETMAVLGIPDLGPLLAAAPPFDPSAALDAAATWVASRSPAEIAPREHVAPSSDL